MVVLSGVGASKGIAFGGIVFYRRTGRERVLRRREGEAEAELVRFEQARLKAVHQLNVLYEQTLRETGAQAAEIFGIHRVLVEDGEYGDAVTALIQNEQVCVEYAVSEAGARIARVFDAMEDAYLRERGADIRDISERMLHILGGTESHMLTLVEPAIVAADDLTPSETVQLDKSKILAFVTRGGSVHSHAAILARMMGIPAVLGMGDALDDAYEGKVVAVDGSTGNVYIEPDDDTLYELRERQINEQGEKQMLAELREKKSVTVDKHAIHICANISCTDDLEAVLASGAEGIGLFRSEFLYLGREESPTEEQQLVAYRAVAEAMKGKRVVIRTLDAGADKQVAYFCMPHEENPALGMRGIRFCLARPAVFKTQLRAIYRAAVYGNVAILLPMLSSVHELREAKRIAASVREALRAEGADFCANVPIGVMIETPAAAIMSDVLAKEADFFSIGTNDLSQYTLAADRQNAALGNLCSACHPAVLRLLRLVVENAHKCGICVGVCGELAANTELAATLLAIGVDELSVAPPHVLELRRCVREIDVSAVKESCLAALE